ncbi:hypothetical protein AB0J82_22005 [Asanoa sp. NPDC049518]|uniref:hypothetical protein n=1 Tax=unclassified Asanoa TaxID=2685164 RepID=UPI003443DE17
MPAALASRAGWLTGSLGRDVFAVRLTWGVGGSSYVGEARMVYDPKRKVYAYRLPAVTRDRIGDSARSIGLHVTVDSTAYTEPPTAAYVSIVSHCLLPPP